MLEFLDVNNVVLGGPPKVEGGGQIPWTTVTLSNKTAPTGTVKVRVSAFIYAPMGDLPSLNGQASYDNFQITIQ